MTAGRWNLSSSCHRYPKPVTHALRTSLEGLGQMTAHSESLAESRRVPDATQLSLTEGGPGQIFTGRCHGYPRRGQIHIQRGGRPCLSVAVPSVTARLRGIRFGRPARTPTVSSSTGIFLAARGTRVPAVTSLKVFPRPPPHAGSRPSTVRSAAKTTSTTGANCDRSTDHGNPRAG